MMDWQKKDFQLAPTSPEYNPVYAYEILTENELWQDAAYFIRGQNNIFFLCHKSLHQIIWK